MFVKDLLMQIIHESRNSKGIGNFFFNILKNTLGGRFVNEGTYGTYGWIHVDMTEYCKAIIFISKNKIF